MADGDVNRAREELDRLFYESAVGEGLGVVPSGELAVVVDNPDVVLRALGGTFAGHLGNTEGDPWLWWKFKKEGE